jgi:hypothetical protein
MVVLKVYGSKAFKIVDLNTLFYNTKNFIVWSYGGIISKFCTSCKFNL